MCVGAMFAELSGAPKIRQAKYDERAIHTRYIANGRFIAQKFR